MSLKMRFFSVGIILLAGSFPVAAQDHAKLDALLKEPILDPQQVLKETQDFLLPLVPALPKFETVEAWEKYAEKLRADMLEKVVYRGEAANWRDAKTKVVWAETVAGGPGYRIKKLCYEALPGLWIPAVLYEPLRLSGKVPVTLNVMGHDGGGKEVSYQQVRCINLAKRGMLALNVEWFYFGQLKNDNYRHGRMNQLDLCGTSGLAPFYLSLKRGLDILLDHPNADPKRVAVSGLSGGGWQTIYISALDTRVTLTNPVAGYSSFRTRLKHFKDLGDSEQTPCDMMTVADYDHLTAMMAPRATLLTYNSKDQCCFEAGYALPPLLEAALPVFRLYKKTKALRGHVNDDPGTHNYEIDNRQAFYRMIGDFFYPGDKSYVREEIPCKKEIKKPAELAVPLPADNKNFNSIALELAKRLPMAAKAPSDKAKWMQQRRARLQEIVAFADYEAKATKIKSKREGELQVTYWQLRLGKTWTAPVVELVRGMPKSTIVVVHDEGRVKAAKAIAGLLNKQYRVLVVDPWYFGECRFNQRDYLFALLVSATGKRPLGIQASQVSAVARWAAKQYQAKNIELHAIGPRSSLFTLVAAATNGNTGAVRLQGSLKSLREILVKNHTVEQMPEMFCFGLLKEFDIDSMAALVEGGEVRMVELAQ